jgi:hypothetical protein
VKGTKDRGVETSTGKIRESETSWAFCKTYRAEFGNYISRDNEKYLAQPNNTFSCVINLLAIKGGW